MQYWRDNKKLLRLLGSKTDQTALEVMFAKFALQVVISEATVLPWFAMQSNKFFTQSDSYSDFPS